MNEKGLLEQINGKLTSIAQVQQGIPQQIKQMRKDTELIAEKAAGIAIEKHEATCTARQKFGSVADKIADATGQITVLRETGNWRKSIAPAARAVGLDKVPSFVWKGLMIIAIGIAGKFGIDGVALLASLNF